MSGGIPRYTVVLKMPDDLQARVDATPLRSDKLALMHAEVDALFVRIKPQIDDLTARGLVTGVNVLRSLGMALIDVDPARVAMAGRELRRIPDFLDVIQDREVDISLD